MFTPKMPIPFSTSVVSSFIFIMTGSLIQLIGGANIYVHPEDADEVLEKRRKFKIVCKKRWLRR